MRTISSSTAEGSFWIRPTSDRFWSVKASSAGWCPRGGAGAVWTSPTREAKLFENDVGGLDRAGG